MLIEATAELGALLFDFGRERGLDLGRALLGGREAFADHGGVGTCGRAVHVCRLDLGPVLLHLLAPDHVVD